MYYCVYIAYIHFVITEQEQYNKGEKNNIFLFYIGVEKNRGEESAHCRSHQRTEGDR
jgi:hypothetical protein